LPINVLTLRTVAFEPVLRSFANSIDRLKRLLECRIEALKSSYGML